MILFLRYPSPPPPLLDRYQTLRISKLQPPSSTFLHRPSTMSIVVYFVQTRKKDKKRNKKTTCILQVLDAKVRPFVVDDRLASASQTIVDQIGTGEWYRLLRKTARTRFRFRNCNKPISMNSVKKKKRKKKRLKRWLSLVASATDLSIHFIVLTLHRVRSSFNFPVKCQGAKSTRGLGSGDRVQTVGPITAHETS